MNSKITGFLNRFPRVQLAFLACLMLFIGLICSRFLMTLSMILFLVAAVISPNMKEDFSKFKKNKAYWATSGIFLLFVVSALSSSDSTEAFVRIRIALPYLILPLSFALLPPFSDRQFKQLLTLFFYAMIVTCFGVFIYYLMNYNEMQFRLYVSQAISTPNKDHIRFSLMINLAVFASVWLLNEKFFLIKKWEKWIFISGILFLVLMLHVLTVRSGILVLYSGSVLIVLYFVIKKKALFSGLVMFLLIASLPYLSYHYIPGVKTKVKLSVYNWNKYKKYRKTKDKKYIEGLSDTRRLLSYEIAWSIAKNNLWTGVGIGDLKNEQALIYKRDYPEQKVMYPHNFFLTVLASTGVPGFLFFIFCFFFPLFYRKNYRNLFFLLFFLTVTLSFITENTLLVAIGVALHSVFLLLSLNSFDAGNIDA